MPTWGGDVFIDRAEGGAREGRKGERKKEKERRKIGKGEKERDGRERKNEESKRGKSRDGEREMERQWRGRAERGGGGQGCQLSWDSPLRPHWWYLPLAPTLCALLAVSHLCSVHSSISRVLHVL